MEERWLSVGGRRVRVVVAGEGDPLVLCHGFLGSAENFDAWQPALGAQRTMVIPDLPGCGASDPLPGAHTSAALAETVLAVMDELRIGDADLAGLCLGAPVACAVARRRRAAVRRLVLHTPLLAPSLLRARFRAQVRALAVPGVFSAVRRLSANRAVSDLYKRLLVEGDGVDAAAADMNFRNQVRAHPRATREWIADLLHVDDAALVTAAPHPVLLLVAADDRLVDVERLRRLAAGAPAVSLVVDRGAGHGWTEECVRRQVAAIGSFLATTAPERRPAA